MKTGISYILICLAVLLAVGCGSDSPVSQDQGPPPQPEPTVLPTVPVPSSVNDPIPAKSAYVDVGLSNPLKEFAPMVESMRQKLDDASMTWTTENRHLKLVCGGVLAIAMCDPAADATYVSESPRLLHQRYWMRLRKATMDPGTSYTHEETVAYGSETTSSTTQTFAQTLGVEVTATAKWTHFEASVKGSYSQTNTREELESVTFTEQNEYKDTYSVAADPNKTIVYCLWQLVDVFTIVDANKNPIHISDTLTHVAIPEVGAVEFLNKDVVYQSVTKFDAP